MQNGHNACIAQIKTFLFHALKQESTMIGGVTAYLVLDKKHKLDTLDDFWNKVSTSTLPLYTSGRNRLLSVRGQDKQKVVTDLWNKYISSKENIRVNITSAIIFK